LADGKLVTALAIIVLAGIGLVWYVMQISNSGVVQTINSLRVVSPSLTSSSLTTLEPSGAGMFSPDAVLLVIAISVVVVLGIVFLAKIRDNM